MSLASFKTTFLALFILVLTAVPLLAQPENAAFRRVWNNSTPWDWFPGNSTCESDNHFSWPKYLQNYIIDLHIDKRGNVYTLGARQYLSDWLETCGPCDPTNVVVRKFDFNGNMVWGHRSVNTCPDGFRGNISTDSSGAVYFSAEHWSDFWNLGCPNYNTGIETISLNSDGQTRWADKYHRDSSLHAGPASLITSRAGRVYVAAWDSQLGDRLLIYNADGSGPISRAFPYPWNVTAQLAEDSHGNIYAFGGGVAKYRPDGELVRQASVPLGVLEAGRDKFGNSYCLTNGAASCSLIKYDSNLTSQWSHSFAQSQERALPTRLCVDPEGNAIVWSYYFATKFGPDGTQIWDQQWDMEWSLIDGIVDQLGRLFTFRTILNMIDTVGVISSFDPDGNLRWDSRLVDLTYPAGVKSGGWLQIDSRGDLYVVSGQDALTIEKFTQPKTLVIRDARNDSIPIASFYLIKVHNNPPVFSEDTLGQFTTNAHGQIEFPFAASEGYLLDQSPSNPVADTLRFGDTLKIAKLVYMKPAVRHPDVLGSMYSIHSDNGNFLADGRLVFDTVELGSIQTVTLKHTEYRYNLLVSLEWDAEESYVQGLTADFKQMSNYLYDVSDGQVRLDTVVILDDRSLWNEADIRISASNVYWPNAGIMGIAWSGFPPITMPRKWFGDPDTCRVFSYLLHPLMDGVSDNYRTMGHELGHYGLGFSDEYVFVDGAGKLLPETARCSSLPAGNYGFMDHHYDRPYFGVLASEMSSEYRYQDGTCRNTMQWYDNSQSCWDDFERWAQGPRDGIYVPILKPSVTDSTERITPTGLNYFPGPNDDLYNLDYDVGRLVRFLAAVVPPDPSIQSVHLKVDTVAAGGLEVQLLRWGANPMYLIDQGITTDLGQLWVLGMDFYQDEILVAGSSRTESLAMKSASGRAGVRKTWMCGSVRPGSGVSRTRSPSTASATGDSVTLSLRPVTGDYPMVCDGQLSDNGWTYGLWFDRALSQAPQLDIITDQGDFVTSIFSVGTDSYGSEVAGYLTVPGKATIWAVDDSSNTFFFSTPFEVTDITAPKQLQKLIGPAGEAVVRIDSVNSSIQRTMILSSAYPVPMNGLDPNAIQAGRTHSLSTHPADLFLGSNSISLSYGDNDLRDQNGAVLGDEASLRIFRWNHSVLQWELVGGFADTASNTVTASISQSGVYGAFTTVVTCCKGRVGDANGQGTYPQEVTIADILTLVTAKYISALPCEQIIRCTAEADANQSGGANPKCSDVTMADIQTLVNHLFIAGPENAPLKECL